ncbi:MAG: CrcB family protein [Verrucomicrobiota bacterium]
MRLAPAIGLGSALGGSCRYLLDELSLMIGSSSFPLATFMVNVSGSLLIGWLTGRWALGGSLRISQEKWHFWMTGFCGGYTTFSTFSFQVLQMLQDGEGQAAGVYAAGSVGFGLLAVWLGMSIAARRNLEAS